METWLSNLRARSLTTRAIVLVLATLAVYAFVLPAAWYFAGVDGMTAAGAAGLACLAGSVAALVLSRPSPSAHGALLGMLMAMVPRLGVPLAVAGAVHIHGDSLFDAGFACYLVMFFEFTLLFGVFLSLPPKACCTGVGRIGRRASRRKQDKPLIDTIIEEMDRELE